MSLPTLLAGIFVCGIVLLYCLTEGKYLSARVKLASTLPASSVEALEANQKASKSIVLPLLFSTAGDSVLQTNCIELQHEFP